MTTSPELTLARAMADRRDAIPASHRLDGPLSSAQAGAALRLAQDRAIVLEGAALADASALRPQVETVLGAPPASRLLDGADIDASDLEAVAGPWFGEAPTPLDLACAGFWLGDLFVNGVDPFLSSRITRFLLTGSKRHPKPAERVSVRRYPTGGISEKQAVLLPALLRSTAEPMQWCSPFLVARRLAHTGGTAEKLSVLPGFRTAHGETIRRWDPDSSPVRYLSAGADLCPRDAAMYRLRGETGTVADTGLMAASIMSKQVAAPADVIILDILYGRTAFLGDSKAATAFGAMCAAIGEDQGVRIEPVTRPADGLLGRSIGPSSEILEAISILRGEATYPSAQSERDRALGFVARLAQLSGRSADRARHLAKDAIESGQAFEELLAVWRDHQVENGFLSAVEDDPRKALLDGLHRQDILAERSGRVAPDPIALADAVNTALRGESASGRQATPRGGLELRVDEGASVMAGQPVAVFYGLDAANRVRDLARILAPRGD